VASGRRFDIRTRIVMCEDCAFVYQNPQPTHEALAKFYELDYRRLYSVQNDAPTHDFLRAQRERGADLLEFVAPFSVGRTVLDVGCGPGGVLLPFREAGFDCVGVEPGPYALWGSSHLELDIRRGLLEELDPAHLEADLILLSFVLEHVKRPGDLIRTARTFLSPDGFILVEVPNLLTVSAPESVYFHVAHLNYFTPRTLTELLVKAGFSIVRLRTKGYGIRAVARLAGALSVPDPASSIRETPQSIQRFLGRYRVLSRIEGSVKQAVAPVLRGSRLVVEAILGARAGAHFEERVRQLYRRARWRTKAR
jgi:2-polyprenyl-3-methyl-5-hydroxy-6-metoxy-1,4-benzoquinol methylase